MITLAALLFAAQPATRPPSTVPRRANSAVVAPTSEWLRGLWVAEKDQGEGMEGCANWTALFLQADGQFLHGEVTGRWTLEGNRLKQQPITYVEGGGDEEQPTGAAQDSRIVRVSADRLRVIGADGKATLYLRCPTPETPVAL